MRTIAWFSSGAASAVAAKLTVDRNPDCEIVRIVIDNEHPDNGRFAEDVGNWIGKNIIELRSRHYRDAWDVWEKTRWLNGPAGARCTIELKKRVRQEYAKPEDMNVFGFDSRERERAKRFAENNFEVKSKFPLIEKGITKSECFRIISEAKIELPAMYRLGYHNANCIGCVKGGMGYWNKIRKDFPEVFSRMSSLERQIGASVINGTYLDELNPFAGRHTDLELPDCGLFCGENLI